MGLFDSITNLVFGTERVKTAKAKCTENKKIAEDKYKEEIKQIEAKCETDLQEAKNADNAAVAPVAQQTSSAPVIQSPSQQGGKKGGRSKKRSKSNRKKTRKYK